MGEDPNQTKAQDVMATNVAYLTPERSVRDVLSLMAAEQVHRVPVVEDGILQGDGKLFDVARCISGSEEEAAMAQTIEEISQTPLLLAGIRRSKTAGKARTRRARSERRLPVSADAGPHAPR